MSIAPRGVTRAGARATRTDAMGCGASSPSHGGGASPNPDPEASAAKHLAPTGASDGPFGDDPFGGDEYARGEDGGGQEERLGLSGVAGPPPPRRTKPRTAPTAGGGQAGVASAGISIDLDLGGGGGGQPGARRRGKRSGIITASGGGGGMTTAAAGEAGGGGSNKALRGVELGALHRALSAACDESRGDAVDLPTFVAAVQSLTADATPPDASAVEVRGNVAHTHAFTRFTRPQPTRLSATCDTWIPRANNDHL